jgi:hypothetical protein
MEQKLALFASTRASLPVAMATELPSESIPSVEIIVPPP